MWTIASRRSLLGIAGAGVAQLAARARRAGRLAGVSLGAALRIAFRFALTVAGLGFLDLAAWSFNRPAGYAALGLSLLVLEWAVKRE